MPADELAAVLKCLLRSRVSTEVLQAQREYYESAISAAEAAVAAAEAAARRDTSSQALLAVAACCAGAVEGLTPAQVCVLATPGIFCFQTNLSCAKIILAMPKDL